MINQYMGVAPSTFQVVYFFKFFTPTRGRFPIWFRFFQLVWNHQLVFFSWQKSTPLAYYRSRRLFLERRCAGGSAVFHGVEGWQSWQVVRLWFEQLKERDRWNLYEMFLLGFLGRVFTLPQTNIAPEIDGWKTHISFWGPAIFQVHAVSFGECSIVPTHSDYYCYDSCVWLVRIIAMICSHYRY